MKKFLFLIGALILFPAVAQAQQPIFIVQGSQPIVLPSSGGSVQVTVVCNWNPCELIDIGQPSVPTNPTACAAQTGNFRYSCLPPFGTQVNGDGGVPACATQLNINMAGTSFQRCVFEINWAGPQIVYTTQNTTFSLGSQVPGGGGCPSGGCFQIVAINLQVAPTPPTSITVTPANSTIGINQAQQFTATGHYSDGTQFDLTSVATWSATGDASVSTSGLVTGGSVAGNATITASYAGVSGSTALTVSANPPPASMAGKWVLFQTSASLTSAGHSCFDSTGTSCYELYADLTQDSNNNLSTPSDPFTPGAYLAIDNANCGGARPNVTGNVSGTNVGLSVIENVLYGAPGGTFAFNGAYSASQPLPGWNLDGSMAPFNGTANEVLGTNASSGGCPAQDAGVAFHAWQYPSLGSSSVTLNVVSRPGILNLPVTINMNLQENADFSASGSGTLTGPSCGPLTFTTTDGQAIGNLYAFDANYTNPAGGTGTLSIGLSLVTPFVVSQQALQQAGYNATAAGLPLQVWSVDWSASSDGSCAADPITIGFGVASPQKVHRHEPHEWKHDEKVSQKLWNSFKGRKE